MTTQVFQLTPGAAVTSVAINSTKVRITANAAVHFAVGAAPVAYSGNCEIVAANQTRYINMQGLGNKIALLANSAAVVVSVTECGSVDPRSIPGQVYVG